MTYQDMKNALQMTDDAAMRLEMVMDFGRDMAVLPADAECHDISGCSSFVQICRRGNSFYGRADSALVRGIVAIIIAMVDGKTPSEIKSMNIRGAFDELNLSLGAGRMNGVNSMVSFLENL